MLTTHEKPDFFAYQAMNPEEIAHFFSNYASVLRLKSVALFSVSLAKNYIPTEMKHLLSRLPPEKREDFLNYVSGVSLNAPKLEQTIKNDQDILESMLLIKKLLTNSSNEDAVRQHSLVGSFDQMV
jgi:hypothetical protein